MKPIQLSANVASITDLGVQIENKSNMTANSLNWAVVLYRESDLVLLSFPTTDVGYVKARSKGNYYELGLESKPRVAIGGGETQIKKGDVFTGSICIDCPDCAGITYVLHLVWGESGWFYGLTDLVGSKLLITKDQSVEGKKHWIQYLKDISPTDQRVPIK